MEHKYLMDICKEYIMSEKFPGYAIWLNGAWGCGKTFLCQKVKEDLEETGLSIWYISLFGVKSIEEIDDKLFEAAHPLVSEGKTGISMLYKISRVAVKHKFNVDIKDIGEAIPGLLKKEPRTCRSLIVDDVANVRLLWEKYQQKCVSLQNSFDLSKHRYEHFAGKYEKLLQYMNERTKAAKEESQNIIC